ncbi:MAG: hypothetical protein MST09_06460, partial [Spirochaetia bacterium]|nr:hypothetical protein [Spirochaetia bacterium]
DKTTKVFCNAQKYDKMPTEKLRTFFKFLVQKKPDETDFSKTLSEKVLKAKIPEDTWRSFMTLEQEVKLAAKHAYQKAYKEACEKFDKKTERLYKKAEIEKIMVIKKAAEEKLESARKMKSKNIPDDVIAECTGLSLQQVQEL